MFKFLSMLFLFISIQSIAGEYAEQANDNPFQNGELNAIYEGEVTALGGTILKHIILNNNNLYLLDLKTESIKNIWVTSFIQPQGKAVVEVGDNVIFKGYISVASNLDKTQQLEKSIDSKTLLMTVYVLNKGR